MNIALVIGILTLSARWQQGAVDWNPGTTFKPREVVVGSDGNYYRALVSSVGMDPTQDSFMNWELFEVQKTIELAVATPPVRFKSITSAWNFLKRARITPPATVTIRIAGGHQEKFSTAFNLNHPSGSQIRMIGGSPLPKMLFSATEGLKLDGGHTFGHLQAISLEAQSSPSLAVTVVGRSRLYGFNVTITGFFF
jgi:hypothetical protein